MVQLFLQIKPEISGKYYNDLLTNEKSVIYSKSNSNIYSDKNGAIEVYYVVTMYIRF